MANIKISELNALTERADNDLLAIVDTSADETKKIQVSDLVNKNIELIAVSDTAPSECSIGDKYYNTTNKEIYTATGTNTWSETGTTPISGILYIVYNDQASYSWDGTDLVSVGGGKEDIVIDDEEPTDPDVKLWIDTGEVESATSEITNEYSTSIGLGYSANYINNIIKGTTLYENSTGTNDVVTLSDSAANYDKIKIYYRDANNFYSNVEVDNPNGKLVCLSIYFVNQTSIRFLFFSSVCKINRTTITPNFYGNGNMYNAQTPTIAGDKSIYITKVVGYKEEL